MMLIMAETITIEVYHGGAWHDAFDVTFSEPAGGFASRTTAAYRNEYVGEHVDQLGSVQEHAVGVRYPVDFEVWAQEAWPAFLLDVMPSGAARRWWRRRLATRDLTENELSFKLLRDHTTSPIGNLRVKSERPDIQPVAFSKEDVCRRDVSFLDYAIESGAAIGGATGAGGDAPKVLLVEDADGNVYPEGTLPDEAVRKSWLVKWPRGQDRDRDRLVLYAEHLYAEAMATIGLDIRVGEHHKFEDSKPSVWFPRFDRLPTEQGLERLAVESFYSMAGISVHGASATHFEYIAALMQVCEADQREDFVSEIICRDILDLIVGNSDNHGRNRAIIRNGGIRLAPYYDVAPMVMDPEGVVRTSRWGDFERGGQIDWVGVFEHVGQWADELTVRENVQRFASQLLDLPDALRDLNLPDEVFDFPRIHLKDARATLKQWGLL